MSEEAITRLMEQRLDSLRKRWEELKEILSDPSVYEDPERMANLQKEYAHLDELMQTYLEYLKVKENIKEAKQIIRDSDDEEFIALAREELAESEKKLENLKNQLLKQLMPLKKEDKKPAIIEIRAGTGGDEAALFAGDLFRMYQRFAERKGYKLEILRQTPGAVGGYKQITFKIDYPGAYGLLKYESGVHRVQRIPITESGGRIHTSAASVVVLPEPDPVEVKIDEKDLKRETFAASGPGGQHVNRNQTAVRLTHIPTGIVVECQDERSQLQNYKRALEILRARLYELELRKRQEELDAKRRSSILTGDRSVKIRTYNFPQNRVTDHRINLTLYKLEEILDGELDPLIEALQIAENVEQLKREANEEHT